MTHATACLQTRFIDELKEASWLSPAEKRLLGDPLLSVLEFSQTLLREVDKQLQMEEANQRIGALFLQLAVQVGRLH